MAGGGRRRRCTRSRGILPAGYEANVDTNTKNTLKAQITALSAANTGFKTMLGMPPPMVMAGMPPIPVSLQPALAPYLGAMKTHADNYDKLLKLLADVIDKS
jgi:hypothetical protein